MTLRAFTFWSQIDRNAWLYGDRTAFVSGAVHTTYREYAARCARLAAGLVVAGVTIGERVAVLAHNCQEYVDALGAVARLGAILVPINSRLSTDEVAYILKDTTPRVLIATGELRHLVPPRVSSFRTYILGPDVDAAGSTVSDLYLDTEPPPAAAIGDDSGLIILHTAAVGGFPRGALLSHRGLLTAASLSQQAWNLTSDDFYLGALPLFHVAGIGQMLAVQMAAGVTVLMPKFDPGQLIRHFDGKSGTLMGSFPPMLGAVLDEAAAAGSTLQGLRLVIGIDTPQTIARFSERCPQAEFWVAYGQTETSGAVSMGRFSERPGSAGKIVAQHMVAIVDAHDRPVPNGLTGEIVVRGPMVFCGYWRLDEDNARTFRDGWHHTGDLGRVDADGYLWYAGRAPEKQLIKPGGENVYPAEVERALLTHPAVAEAVAFGVPDEQWGEAVRAVCELRAGHWVTPEALIDFVGQSIARYKKPKSIEFVTAVPRTPSGATDLDAIRAKWPVFQPE